MYRHPICHSERSEESMCRPRNRLGRRFFAALRMTGERDCSGAFSRITSFQKPTHLSYITAELIHLFAKSGILRYRRMMIRNEEDMTLAAQRICSNCGAANPSDAVSCSFCAASLKTTTPLAPEPADVVPVPAPNTAHLKTGDLCQQRYRILMQVGVGGFGAVYKAEDTQEQNRMVAIKEIGLRGLTPQQVIEATGAFNREVA